MTIIKEEVLSEARALYEDGAKRLELERELGLSQTTAYELYSRLLLEDKINSDPTFIPQLRNLYEDGAGRHHIARACGISLTMTKFAIQHIKTLLHDEEIRLDSDEDIELRRKLRADRESERTELLKNVTRLLDDGMGSLEIASELGLDPKRSADLIEEIRAEEFTRNRMISKSDKFDLVDRLLDGGKSAFAVARALDVSPGAAQKLVRKVRGKLDLNAETFKHAIARGSTLKQLINKFGVKDAAEVSLLISEMFPKYLLSVKDIGDDDLYYTVIPDTTDQFEWMHADKEPRRFRFSVSPEENYMFIKMDEDVTEMQIFNFTDVHVGHKRFDEKRFLADIEFIKNTPNAFFVLGGDIFEWAHKMSVGQPWEQVLAPMEQVTRAAKLLMPIAHKGFAYRSGNHDKGRGKLVGADLAEVLAGMLEIPYFKVESILQFQLGTQLFTVSLDHGHSGGSIQSILRDAEKYKEYSPYMVHFHLSGHVHNSQIIERVVKDLEVGKGFSFKRTYTVIGGSYLDFTGSYAEEAKYTPTPQDLTFIDISSSGAYSAGKVRHDGQ